MARLSPLFLAALVFAPATASADYFKLYGEARAGGMFGNGLSGDTKDDAFFKRSRGIGYGPVVGGRILVLDGNIKHMQYRHAGDYNLTTWTQFNAGLAFEVNLGTEVDKKAHTGNYIEIGAWAGFGVGTGAQVDPPLDASEVTDKGFFLEGQFGFGKHLNKIFDIGVVVPVSWGYFFKSGAANDQSNQYQSYQIDVMLTLRANIRFI